jgi:transcriptional regulator with GAF, ATPase, and Fis domain
MSKPQPRNTLGLDEATDALQRKMLVEALEQNATLDQAARQLKLSLSRLHYLKARHGIKRSVKVTRTVEVRFSKK